MRYGARQAASFPYGARTRRVWQYAVALFVSWLLSLLVLQLLLFPRLLEVAFLAELKWLCARLNAKPASHQFPQVLLFAVPGSIILQLCMSDSYFLAVFCRPVMSRLGVKPKMAARSKNCG